MVKVIDDEVKVGCKKFSEVGVAQWSRSWSLSSATSINWCRAVAIRTNEVPRSGQSQGAGKLSPFTPYAAK